MQPSQLDVLHQRFNEALQKNKYISVDANNNTFNTSNTKTIPLHQIFALASREIDGYLIGKSILELQKEVTYLNALDKDGENYYKRYEKKSSSLIRRFLKVLNSLTPTFLKPFLPSCFSNGIAAAEVKTKEEYKNYKEKIKGHLDRRIGFENLDLTKDVVGAKGFLGVEINDLNKPNPINATNDSIKANPKNDLNPFNSKSGTTTKQAQNPPKEETMDDSDPVLQQAIIESQKASQGAKKSKDDASDQVNTLDFTPDPQQVKLAEKKHQNDIQIQHEILKNSIQELNESSKTPCSLNQYIKNLKKLVSGIEFLKKSDLSQDSLKSLGLDTNTLQALDQGALKDALSLKNNELILASLVATPWHSSFNTVATTYKKYELNFGKNDTIRLKNEEGTNVSPKVLTNYTQEISLPLEIDGEERLKKFIAFLNQNKQCIPCKVILSFPSKTLLSPNLLELIQNLRTLNIREIQIDGIEEINLKDLAMNEDQEHQFVQSLEKWDFTDLKSIVLLDRPKNKWSSADFSTLFYSCPSLDTILQCYRLSTSPDIYFPKVNSKNQPFSSFDLRQCPIDHIPRILQDFCPIALDLSSQKITDQHIQNWVKAGYLNKIETLMLNDCTLLTTDTIHSLAKIKFKLLSLPNLPKGKIELKKLPKFEDPLQIVMFYTSDVTRNIACELYTGCELWTSLFQILLARAGAKTIFSPSQKVLDPKTVALWLYKGDYKNISPDQNSITRILADSNGYLTDDNLVEFIQKFPKVQELSLHNCPHITHKGIIELLTKCPRIKKLDLTDCRLVTKELLSETERLFLKNNELPPNEQRQLRTLVLVNTGIDTPTIGAFAMKNIIQNTKTERPQVLKITNDQILSEQEFEELLNKLDLRHLKHIDLSECTALNDAMLSKLLARLNADEFFMDPKGRRDNPQRLNLTSLNLTGCTNITDQAFVHATASTGKIEYKILGNLNSIVYGGTQISDDLKNVYSSIIFQDKETPLTIEIDPPKQLADCLEVLSSSPQDPSNKLQKLKRAFTDNLMSTLIFSTDCDRNLLQRLVQNSISFGLNDHRDFTLKFRMKDTDNLIEYPVHRDLLYMYSRLFKQDMRPGGRLSRENDIGYTNQHLRPEVCEEIINILYRKGKWNKLDCQTAASVAEIIGAECLQFPTSYYDKLLKHLHSLFDLSNAVFLLDSAVGLKDTQGFVIYDKWLSKALTNLAASGFDNPKNEAQRVTIRNLVNSQYPLPMLRKKVLEIDDEQNAIQAIKIMQKDAQQTILDPDASEKASQALIAKLLLVR